MVKKKEDLLRIKEYKKYRKEMFSNLSKESPREIKRMLSETNKNIKGLKFEFKEAKETESEQRRIGNARAKKMKNLQKQIKSYVGELQKTKKRLDRIV